MADQIQNRISPFRDEGKMRDLGRDTTLDVNCLTAEMAPRDLKSIAGNPLDLFHNASIRVQLHS